MGTSRVCHSAMASRNAKCGHHAGHSYHAHAIPYMHCSSIVLCAIATPVNCSPICMASDVTCHATHQLGVVSALAISDNTELPAAGTRDDNEPCEGSPSDANTPPTSKNTHRGWRRVVFAARAIAASCAGPSPATRSILVGSDEQQQLERTAERRDHSS